MTEQHSHQYIPLYRKYRPQEFADLVGQDNLVKTFTNAINTGRIAHAYLFCGPRGTGKTSSARILAKSLNCQNGPTLTPCGKCPSCQDILNGNMLDVIEMDAASNRSVEDAQNIIDKIHYAPVNGKYKIFIIDEVHMISKTAFNALLKTLEEPPENVIFILATTEPQKVLETIISRCQRFDFRRITVEDIVKRLEYISKKENIKIGKDALFAIAKNSQGGMRDALALLDQLSVLDVEDEITPDKVNEMLGKINNETLFKFAQYIFDKSVENLIQEVNKIYSKGNEPLQIIENLIQYFRNLSVVKTCKEEKVVSDLTLLSNDNISAMKNQSEKVSISEISYIIERLSYYHKEIKFTNNRYLWLELCFIDLASGKSVIQNEETAPVSFKQPKSEIVVKPVEQPQRAEENEIIKELEKPVEITEVKNEEKPEEEIKPQKATGSTDDWKKILELVESPPSRSFFTTFAKPVELSPTKVIISFKYANFAERAKEAQKSDALKKACIRYYNVPSIELEIKTGEVPAPKVSVPFKKDNIEEKINEDIAIPEISEEQETVPERIELNEETTAAQEEVEVDKIAPMDKPYVKYNDQVKMVKDMFDAKVFD